MSCDNFGALPTSKAKYNNDCQPWFGWVMRDSASWLHGIEITCIVSLKLQMLLRGRLSVFVLHDKCNSGSVPCLYDAFIYIYMYNMYICFDYMHLCDVWSEASCLA